MHAAGHSVEVNEPRSQAGESSLALMIIFNGGDRLAHQFLHGIGAALHAFFANLQDIALYFVQESIDIALALKSLSDNGGAGMDHFPQDILLANNGEIVLKIGRRRHRVGQRRDKREAADGVELLFVLEALLEGDGIDGDFAVVHLHHRFIDGAMAEVVKYVRAGFEFCDALPQAFGSRKHDATKHSLLCLQ